jgi:hypothetical protein
MLATYRFASVWLRFCNPAPQSGVAIVGSKECGCRRADLEGIFRWEKTKSRNEPFKGDRFGQNRELFLGPVGLVAPRVRCRRTSYRMPENTTMSRYPCLPRASPCGDILCTDFIGSCGELPCATIATPKHMPTPHMDALRAAVLRAFGNGTKRPERRSRKSLNMERLFFKRNLSALTVKDLQVNHFSRLKPKSIKLCPFPWMASRGVFVEVLVFLRRVVG